MTGARKLAVLFAAALMVLSAAGAGVGAALASGSAAPAPAANVDGCTVIDQPGTYEITGDITTNQTGPCIEIRASDVTLDGNGHFVSQTEPYENETDGVYVNGTDRTLTNVTVENMTVENWRIGVYYDRTSESTVRDVTSLGNLYGVRTRLSDNITVERSEARYNSLGFTDISSQDLEFRENVAIENRWGFHFEEESTDHVLVDNYAANSTYHSFYTNNVSEPANYLVENFTVGEDDLRASVDFEGGHSVALKPATSTPDAPGNQTDVGTYVTVSRSGGGTTLDSLTVHYVNASGVNESTLSLWQYDPSSDSWSEFDDPNDADPAANAVTVEGVLGGDMDNSDIVVAPVGDAHDGVNASLVADPAEAEVNTTNVTLNASETATDGDAEYRWDVNGNGTVDEVTADATTTHTYTSTGEYDATVTVADGGTTDTATATVNVTSGDDGGDGGDGSDGGDGGDGSDGDDGSDDSDGNDGNDGDDSNDGDDGSNDGGGSQSAGGSQPVDGESVMTVDVESGDDGVTATVRDGNAGEAVDVTLADYDVGTPGVTYELLSTTLTADADGSLAVTANEASPLADDAAAESFEPVSYLTITENLPLENESVRVGVDNERLDAFDAEPSDVTAMIYTDDGWERVETEVAITADGRAFDVDADGIDNDTVVAVGVDRPALEVADVAASGDAAAGDTVPVEVTVTNDGATDGTTTVALQVDGEERTTRNVTVPDDESVTVTFEAAFDEAGTYDVAAGNATASVSVSEAQTTTTVDETTATTAATSEATVVEAASTEGQPGFGPAIALVALVAAALLALRRRR